jgi:hypothetical protein
MVGFDGTNDYLTATNAVLGQSDGKNALISLWWDFTGTTDGSELHIIGLTNDKISIGREGAGNKIRVYLKNAANTVICRTDTTNTVTASDGLVHIAISIELGNTTAADRIQVWINGVKETMVAAIGPVDDTIDFTDSVFWLGAGTGPLYKCKGLLGQFYFAQEFLDLDVASNLEKVFVEYGIPVNMGSNGSAVTGTQPLIFLNNPLATWQENLGSGGNFTEVGDLYDGGELVGWHSQFGLSRETVYYVVNKTTNTFQVSATSGGSAVAFTDDVTGTHSVRVVTKAALVDRGDFETGKATLSALVDISGQPTDTDMSLIVQTKNNKGTKLHGMSMQYT